MLGGADGGVNEVRVTRGGETHVPPHLSKEQDIHVSAGDRIRVSTPGGGGFGDPLDRDPELVRADVSRGYYTVGQAAELYGVALSAGGAVDPAATEALRAARRATARAAE